MKAPPIKRATLAKNFGGSRRHGGGLGGLPPDIDTNPFDDLTFLNTCVFNSGHEGEEGENDINEDLCDLGIDDITFGANYPNLILDADNGYLHLSTKLFIQVYEWLAEEVALDE